MHYLKMTGKGGKNAAKKEKTVAAFVKQHVGPNCQGCTDIIGEKDGRLQGEPDLPAGAQPRPRRVQMPAQPPPPPPPEPLPKGYFPAHAVQAVLFILYAFVGDLGSRALLFFYWFALLAVAFAFALLPTPHDAQFGLGEHVGYMLMHAQAVPWPMVVVPHLFRLYFQAPGKGEDLGAKFAHINKIAADTAYPIFMWRLVQDWRLMSSLAASVLMSRQMEIYFVGWPASPFLTAIGYTLLSPLPWYWYALVLPILLLTNTRFALFQLVAISLLYHQVGLLGAIAGYVLPPLAIGLMLLATAAQQLRAQQQQQQQQRQQQQRR